MTRCQSIDLLSKRAWPAIRYAPVFATVVIGYPTHVRATDRDLQAVDERTIQQTIRSYNAHLSRIEVMTYKDLADTAERALAFENEAATASSLEQQASERPRTDPWAAGDDLSVSPFDLASSSRSQVQTQLASAAARLAPGATVRGCPLASTVGGGDCHSLGHSVAPRRLPLAATSDDRYCQEYSETSRSLIVVFPRRMRKEGRVVKFWVSLGEKVVDRWLLVDGATSADRGLEVLKLLDDWPPASWPGLESSAGLKDGLEESLPRLADW